ncbi:hypothetical protein [Alkalihalobacillus pseudalcaliphilus]|uniref:hypothetical protein n=1 Tax=Alkalihalobacillus pseudalcaliphilus TaxID=79884 RepID=UPI00235F2638|nr:hypothetical protein [Alkalihalobacillus pseudalcaliphilus]
MEHIVGLIEPSKKREQVIVLKMEIDYELMSLYEAITNLDDATKLECIRKLKRLQKELKRYQ